MKHAQTSIEASLLITFMILVLVMFMGLFTKRAVNTQNSMHAESLERIAQIIKREILLADSVQPGYQRNFSLPTYVGGMTYNITLINSSVLGTNYSELVIQSNSSANQSTVELLPVNVNGELCPGIHNTNVIEKKAQGIYVRCE